MAHKSTAQKLLLTNDARLLSEDLKTNQRRATAQSPIADGHSIFNKKF
ncbi:MAG: hypothetical protein NTX86_00640 [Candidatus Dependentiae bacterium]|nr:hypothetical protein [Candidatus Dependentiae bacterium]